MWLRLFSIQLYLAFDRLRHRVQRRLFFWRRDKGSEVFLERYRPDSVLAVTSQERTNAIEFERCVLCSLCVYSCEAIQKGEALPGFEPKLIAAVFAKSHEAELFTDSWFPCVQCKACSVLCPNGVPLHTMANQLVQRRQNLGFKRSSQRIGI